MEAEFEVSTLRGFIVANQKRDLRQWEFYCEASGEPYVAIHPGKYWALLSVDLMDRAEFGEAQEERWWAAVERLFARVEGVERIPAAKRGAVAYGGKRAWYVNGFQVQDLIGLAELGVELGREALEEKVGAT